MIYYLKSVKQNIENMFDETVVFWLGYLIASISTSCITFVIAAILSVAKRLNIEVLREAHKELNEISRESFDRFLNRIQVLLPDKVRQSLAWDAGCW